MSSEKYRLKLKKFRDIPLVLQLLFSLLASQTNFDPITINLVIGDALD